MDSPLRVILISMLTSLLYYKIYINNEKVILSSFKIFFKIFYFCLKNFLYSILMIFLKGFFLFFQHCFRWKLFHIKYKTQITLFPFLFTFFSMFVLSCFQRNRLVPPVLAGFPNRILWSFGYLFWVPSKEFTDSSERLFITGSFSIFMRNHPFFFIFNITFVVILL